MAMRIAAARRPSTRTPDARRRLLRSPGAAARGAAGADSRVVHDEHAAVRRRAPRDRHRRASGAQAGRARRPKSASSPSARVSSTRVGVQMRRGRGFNANDGTPGNETAIINETMAAQLFAGEDPIGRRIRIAQSPAGTAGPPRQSPPGSPGARLADDRRHQSRRPMHTPPQDTGTTAVMYVPLRQEPAQRDAVDGPQPDRAVGRHARGAGGGAGHRHRSAGLLRADDGRR